MLVFFLSAPERQKSLSQGRPSCVLESTFIKAKRTIQGAVTGQRTLQRRPEKNKQK